MTDHGAMTMVGHGRGRGSSQLVRMSAVVLSAVTALATWVAESEPTDLLTAGPRAQLAYEHRALSGAATDGLTTVVGTGGGTVLAGAFATGLGISGGPPGWLVLGLSISGGTVVGYCGSEGGRYLGDSAYDFLASPSAVASASSIPYPLMPLPPNLIFMPAVNPPPPDGSN